MHCRLYVNCYPLAIGHREIVLSPVSKSSNLQELQQTMAFSFTEDSDIPLASLRGHDMTWTCDETNEPIKLFCDSHKRPLCIPCAFTGHQTPCEVRHIGIVIKELRNKLDENLLGIGETKQQMTELAEQMTACSEFLDDHLEMVKRNAVIVSETKLEGEREKERSELREINEEAENEIRVINEKRDLRIRKCREKAKRRQRYITDHQQKLLQDVQEIAGKVQEAIAELETRHQFGSLRVEDDKEKMKELLQNDKQLVTYGFQVIASRNKPDIKETQVMLDHIKQATQTVRFSASKDNDGFCGRIDGYDGKWELVDTIDIPPHVVDSKIVGLIGDDEVAISEQKGHLYITHLTNRTTEKVLEGGETTYITSCAHVTSSDTIVCGRYAPLRHGSPLDKCIELYDRKWNFTRNITIPVSRLPDDWPFTHMYADVDRNGMILATETCGSNIHVINPADNEIVTTFTAPGVRDRILTLSSGNVVVKTGLNTFTILSRLGTEEALIHDQEWRSAECNVDTFTDTLYITNRPYPYRVIRVDQVSADGTIQARRIAEYPGSKRCFLPSPTVMTPSGKLVSSNGDKIFIFKKLFVLNS